MARYIRLEGIPKQVEHHKPHGILDATPAIMLFFCAFLALTMLLAQKFIRKLTLWTAGGIVAAIMFGAGIFWAICHSG
jgi:hypothetical protein